MNVHFAGMETVGTSYDYTPQSGDNIFCTYFYRKNTEKWLGKINKKNHRGSIIIDSGAHSFFGVAGISSSAHHNNSKKTLPPPEEYLKEYIGWMKKYYDKVDYFVELDIQAIVGLEKVREWRQWYRDAGVADKVIPVFHSVDEWEDLEDIVKNSESRYIGCEGLRNKKMTVPFMKILKYCYDAEVKVHGFAMTNADYCVEFPFYSVDSTTWLAPVRYGTIIETNKHGLVKQYAGSKENYMQFNTEAGAINTRKDRVASAKRLEISAQKFRDFEGYVTKLWESRGVQWDEAT